MRELPRVNVSEDFYMWFDLEEKKEHYATPLYLYQVKRDRINPDDETKLYLKFLLSFNFFISLDCNLDILLLI